MEPETRSRQRSSTFSDFGCWRFHWPTSWRFRCTCRRAARTFPLWRRKLRLPRSVLFYSNKGAGKNSKSEISAWLFGSFREIARGSSLLYVEFCPFKNSLLGDCMRKSRGLFLALSLLIPAKVRAQEPQPPV